MADPITREQVERLIAGAPTPQPPKREGPYNVLGKDWERIMPAYVVEAWHTQQAEDDDFAAYRAALTGWRDELAAAEPVRRVARWDATRGAYVALDAHGTVCMVASDCVDCIAWGYEVGDLDPALRETARRMVAALRSGSFVPSGYIALPGAAEWRVSDHSPEADARWAVQLDALLGEPASPPAPEVVPIDTSGPVTIVAGDGMRLAVNGVVVCERSYVAQSGDLVSAVAWVEAPERAPEVVDVPQPRVLVKRCDEVEAEWTSADATILIVTHDALDDAIFVPLALLRAVLEAIDAQQGGA